MKRRGFLRFLAGAPLLPLADLHAVLEPPVFDAAEMTWTSLSDFGPLEPTQAILYDEFKSAVLGMIDFEEGTFLVSLEP